MNYARVFGAAYDNAAMVPAGNPQPFCPVTQSRHPIKPAGSTSLAHDALSWSCRHIPACLNLRSRHAARSIRHIHRTQCRHSRCDRPLCGASFSPSCHRKGRAMARFPYQSLPRLTCCVQRTILVPSGSTLITGIASKGCMLQSSCNLSQLAHMPPFVTGQTVPVNVDPSSNTTNTEQFPTFAFSMASITSLIAFFLASIMAIKSRKQAISQASSDGAAHGRLPDFRQTSAAHDH